MAYCISSSLGHQIAASETICDFDLDVDYSGNIVPGRDLSSRRLCHSFGCSLIACILYSGVSRAGVIRLRTIHKS
jgi:hypothetical protein